MRHGAQALEDDKMFAIGNFLERLDCPRALSVWLLFSNGEDAQLLDLPAVQSRPFEDPRSFYSRYQATKFLAKAKFLKPGIDLKAVALSKESEAEEQCRRTNEFLRSDTPERNRLLTSSAVARARSLISRVLADLDSFLGINNSVGWTKGRNTVNSARSALHGSEKFSSRLECTPASFGFLLREVQASPLWGQSALKADGPVSILFRGLDFIEGNVLMTVPKNSKTDRIICYEPNGNIWCQRMVGSYLQWRLRHFGVDLTDQTKNQSLARRGSRDNSLATLDLSSASDTLCIETVWELLPLRWASFLNNLRSRSTLLPSGWRVNEKFSSMGNGFTFELESLIFWALCKSVSCEVSVFGDDIIVDTPSVKSCVSLLTAFGFKLNEEKSYFDGPFRESCGGDYFLGDFVTPIFLRDFNPGWSVKLHNQLWDRLGEFPTRDEFEFVRSFRLEDYPLGPHGFGDGHYSSNLDEAHPQKARHGLEGWWYHSVVERRPSLVKTRKHRNRSGIVQIYSQADLRLGSLLHALGPRAPRSVVETLVNPRKKKTHVVTALAPFWPEVLVI